MTAANSLILEHRDLALAVARNRKLGRRDLVEAEGVALLALVEAAQSFDPARGCKFSTYATGKIRWAIAASFRGKAGEVLDDQMPDSGANPEEMCISCEADAETIALARKARRVLSPRERQVIKATIEDELTVKEAAARLGVSRETARAIRDSALGKMHSALAKPSRRDRAA